MVVDPCKITNTNSSGEQVFEVIENLHSPRDASIKAPLFS
jgi:hypothetical protein